MKFRVNRCASLTFEICNCNKEYKMRLLVCSDHCVLLFKWKSLDVSRHHVLTRTPSLPNGGDPFLKAAVFMSNQSFDNPNGNI